MARLRDKPAEARSAGRTDRAGAQDPGADREGLTNRQIGERMYLAEKTVKNYVSALYAKLGMERGPGRRPARPAPSTIITTPMAARPTSVREMRTFFPGLARRVRGILGAMYSDGSGFEELSRDRVPAADGIGGRGWVIYTRRALPAVELVNFAFDHGDIVIRTDRSGKLAAAARGAVVAFEADCLDRRPACRLERHRHRAVAGSDRSQGNRPTAEDGPATMGSRDREHFIRISPVIMTGRHRRAQRTATRSTKEVETAQIITQVAYPRVPDEFARGRTRYGIPALAQSDAGGDAPGRPRRAAGCGPGPCTRRAARCRATTRPASPPRSPPPGTPT